jgi:hypothetical protein
VLWGARIIISGDGLFYSNQVIGINR